jgi:hypothetical protein
MTQWGLDTLFNPAKRHMDEEKQRLQSTREEVGDSSGGKRIDLESGKVTIKRAARDGDAPVDEADEAAYAAEADEHEGGHHESGDEASAEGDSDAGHHESAEDPSEQADEHEGGHHEADGDEVGGDAPGHHESPDNDAAED